MQAKYLLKTLQGVLMILPISNSFKTLKTRIECVNIAPYWLPTHEKSQNKEATGLDLNECISIFDSHSQQMEEWKKIKARKQ